MKQLQILLVSPAYRNAIGWNSIDIRDGVSADIAPLALATLTGLTPPHIHVDVWDELASGEIDETTEFPREYDFIGITGYSGHVQDVMRIAAVFRKRGGLIGVGGPGVSVHPHHYRDTFDVLFIGEAEDTWPRFLRDLEAGSPEREYVQITKPDLTESSTPDWTKLDMSKYGMGALQTTRGCPFDCEFCDVIYLFGRKMRHKAVARVVEEFRRISTHPYDAVFFSDDEFVGDKRYTKELLRGLLPVNQALERPKSFITQSTVTAASDPELLQLATDAGFYFFYIGIETPNPDNLKSVNKIQNLEKDLVAECHKIMQYGIAVRCNSIIGFDHDDTSSFDSLYEFHQRVGAPLSSVGILMAPEGTPLWRRLREEGRVIYQENQARGRFDETKGAYQFNTIPKLMSRIELLDGYSYLIGRLNSWTAIGERVHRWLSVIAREPQIRLPSYSHAEYQQLLRSMESRWQLDAEGRATIDELVGHLLEAVPFMWHRFRMLITQMTGMRRMLLTSILPAVERRRKLEVSGAAPVVPDTRKPPVTRAFRARVRELFPRVHRRVYANLDDKSLLADALTTVFLDFLTRWGEDLESTRAQHLEFLAELCDRTCARLNGASPEQFVAVDGDEVPTTGWARLRDDVLRNFDIRVGFDDLGAIAQPPPTTMMSAPAANEGLVRLPVVES